MLKNSNEDSSPGFLYYRMYLHYENDRMGDYEKYKEQISDDMDRMEFLHLVQDYLSTFKVFGHLRLRDNTLGSMGFSVARYEDALYVTSANKI